MRELIEEEIDLYDVLEVLEKGFDCPSGRRKEGTLEKCLQRGNKILKAVVRDLGNYWDLKHVGSFKFTKKKLKQIKG